MHELGEDHSPSASRDADVELRGPESDHLFALTATTCTSMITRLTAVQNAAGCLGGRKGTAVGRVASAYFLEGNTVKVTYTGTVDKTTMKGT